MLQEDKRKRIEESAAKLFMEKGIEQTSVNDIVKDARLAKGTFYNYYKDKTALIDEIIVKKNVTMLHDMMDYAWQKSQKDKVNCADIFLQQLIRFYKENPNVLRMINRSFHMQRNRDYFIAQIREHIHHFDEFLHAIQRESEEANETLNRFLLMMEITGFVCYNAIFYQQPDDIEHVAKLLYDNMRRSFAASEGGTL